MKNKDQDPGNVEVKAYHALRSAFDRATRWFGNLLAPLVIVTYAKDVQQAIDFIVARPVLTGTFALVFVAVLAYNIFRNLDIQFRLLKWRREHSLLGGCPRINIDSLLIAS
jgi:hypothetical protein